MNGRIILVFGAVISAIAVPLACLVFFSGMIAEHPDEYGRIVSANSEASWWQWASPFFLLAAIGFTILIVGVRRIRQESEE